MNFSPESLREDSSADVKRKENVPPSQVTPPKKSPRLASLQDVLDHDPPPLVHQDPPHDDDNAVPPPVTNSRSSPPPPLVPQQHPKIKIGRRKNQFSNAGGTVSRPPSSSSSLISGNLLQFHILRAFIGVNFRSVTTTSETTTLRCNLSLKIIFI